MAKTKNSSSKLDLAYLDLFHQLLNTSDARAVLETSVQLMENNAPTPEVVAARQGMRLLGYAYDGLDAAIGRLPVKPHAKLAAAAMKATKETEHKPFSFDEVVRRLVNSLPAPASKKVKPKRKNSTKKK